MEGRIPNQSFPLGLRLRDSIDIIHRSSEPTERLGLSRALWNVGILQRRYDLLFKELGVQVSFKS